MIIYYYIYLHLCAEQLASFVAFCDVQLHCTSGMLSSWQNESFLLYTDTQSCLVVVVVVLADVECVCTWPCVSNHLAVADQANTRPVADVSLVVVSACVSSLTFSALTLLIWHQGRYENTCHLGNRAQPGVLPVKKAHSVETLTQACRLITL